MKIGLPVKSVRLKLTTFMGSVLRYRGRTPPVMVRVVMFWGRQLVSQWQICRVIIPVVIGLTFRLTKIFPWTWRLTLMRPPLWLIRLRSVLVPVVRVLCQRRRRPKTHKLLPLTRVIVALIVIINVSGQFKLSVIMKRVSVKPIGAQS